MGQQVINGLFLGSIYALFALGYTLVFGVLDILNLAHAAVFMLATFVAVALVGHGLHILLALPLAVLFAGLVGAAAGAGGLPAAAGPDRLQHLRADQLAGGGHHHRGGRAGDLGAQHHPLPLRDPSRWAGQPAPALRRDGVAAPAHHHRRGGGARARRSPGWCSGRGWAARCGRWRRARGPPGCWAWTSTGPSPPPSSSPRRWAAPPACSTDWPSTPSPRTWGAAWS